ncbi:hypothetical protein HMPREF3190_01505 [Umbribacter vaginalis]|nr:hypothetical protein HMPREF3190_01505 [Coriobacteriales bacterium DNF00809]
MSFLAYHRCFMVRMLAIMQHSTCTLCLIVRRIRFCCLATLLLTLVSVYDMRVTLLFMVIPYLCSKISDTKG